MFSPQPRNGPLLGSSAPTPVLNPAPKALPKQFSRDANDTPGGWSDTTTAPSRDERELAQPLEAHTASAAQSAEGQTAGKNKKRKKDKNEGKKNQHAVNKHLKVFVGGLSQSTENKTLADAFTALGRDKLRATLGKQGGFVVHDAEVIRDKDTQRSRGFGYVEFKPKRTEIRFGQYVEGDLSLAEHFWEGSDQPQDGMILRIDGVDCGVYEYEQKGPAQSKSGKAKQERS
jgi:RNA recognition motif-containing protein